MRLAADSKRQYLSADSMTAGTSDGAYFSASAHEPTMSCSARNNLAGTEQFCCHYCVLDHKRGVTQKGTYMSTALAVTRHPCKFQCNRIVADKST